MRAEIEPAPGCRFGRSSSLTRSRSSCPRSTSRRSPRFPVLAALWHPPGGIIRHDAVVWGYARRAEEMGVDIHQYTEVTGIDVADGRVTGIADESRPDPRRHRRQRDRRLGLDDRGDGRCAPADRDPPAAGARHRTAQAVPRPGPRVGHPPRVRQSDRPRRTRDRLGDRPLRVVHRAAPRCRSSRRPRPTWWSCCRRWPVSRSSDSGPESAT